MTDDPKCESCGVQWADHVGIMGTCARLQAAEQRVAELERAIAPFRDIARGIPDNWPGEARLRVEHQYTHERYFVTDAGERHTMPTIAEWRRLVEVAPQPTPAAEREGEA